MPTGESGGDREHDEAVVHRSPRPPQQIKRQRAGEREENRQVIRAR